MKKWEATEGKGSTEKCGETTFEGGGWWLRVGGGLVKILWGL